MLKVTSLPIFSDNYVWIIHQPSGKEVLVVDPGDAPPIIRYLTEQSLEIVGMLITHSHFDHISGIDGMLKHKSVPVYGPDCSAIPQVDYIVGEGDVLEIWNYRFEILSLPGHLPEHVAYVATTKADEGEAATQIFSADIIFSAGCGRIFDGSHAELKSSLDRIKSYPLNTLIYPAHEYTAANLAFAAAVEPENENIANYQESVMQRRNKNIPSLPTNLKLELEINPFLRCHEKSVVKAANERLRREPHDEDEVFKTLRLWKDSF